MLRRITLSLCLVFLLSNVGALTIGTFPQQSEKESKSLNMSFSIGVINTGDEAVRISLDSEPGNYSVEFPEQDFILESSEITSDPSGSGWYHIGNGRYAKIRYVDFKVDISPYRDSNTVDIPVELRAFSIAGRSGNSGNTRLVQLRDYTFRANLHPSLDPLNRPDEKEEEQSWRDLYWSEQDARQNNENEEKEEDGQISREKSGNTSEESINSSNSSKNYKASGTDESTGEQGINGLTLVLATAILGMAVYIFKVV